MRTMTKLLGEIKAVGDKVVLVSNWTASLDIFESFCKAHSYSFLRLDGKSPTSSRQANVDRFNNNKDICK